MSARTIAIWTAAAAAAAIFLSGRQSDRRRRAGYADVAGHSHFGRRRVDRRG